VWTTWLFFFSFWQYCGLNSVPCTFKALAL
jgi:hypothetical protein